MVPHVDPSYKNSLKKQASLLQGDDDPIVIAIGHPQSHAEFKPMSLMAALSDIGAKTKKQKKDGTMAKRPTSGLSLKKHAVSP